MDKLTFLKDAFKAGAHRQLRWVLSVLTVTASKKDEAIAYEVIREPFGVYFKLPNGELESLEGVKDEPVFTINEKITLTPDFEMVDSSVETTFGRALANRIAIFDVFKHKIPYINKSFSVSTVEKMVAPKLISDGDEGDGIYVKEYIEFVKAIDYLCSLEPVIVSAATAKLITSPAGFDKLFKELVEKYKGRLSDPIVLAEFENELKALDDKYLKDDPGYGKFISGKVKNIARKRLFLTFGTGLEFEEREKVRYILEPLAKGWNINPDDYVTMMNDIRFGSFSRGKETVKGGVTFKTLARVANPIKISEKDCGTKLYRNFTVSEYNYDQLEQRYIQTSKGPVLIETKDQGKAYIGKTVQLRSPLYCKEPNGNYCKICSGNKIARHKNGLVGLSSEISNSILTSSLKLMHGVVLSTAKVDLNRDLS